MKPTHSKDQMFEISDHKSVTDVQDTELGKIETVVIDRALLNSSADMGYLIYIYTCGSLHCFSCHQAHVPCRAPDSCPSPDQSNTFKQALKSEVCWQN